MLDKSFSNRNGKLASTLLGFRDSHIYQTNLQLENPEDDCERNLSPPLDEVAAAHLRCCWAVANHDFAEAYNCQSACVQSFIKLFSSQKDENWALPILFAATLDLRLFANSADVQLTQSGHGKHGETLEKAAEILMSCFRICASDNRAALEDSKKWGMLNLVNQLFKIYFKINKLHLCKPLIRAIDSLPIKDQFTISQLVTYRFYVGRKAMFDSDYKAASSRRYWTAPPRLLQYYLLTPRAEEYLTFAFQRCHKGAKKNKRLILIYLLPVKMLLGHMPKRGLLEKYNLLQFADVACSVSSGNLSLLNKALETNEAFFIKCGIYLILEKLKTITYRNLIKKVALIQKTHQLPISAFTVAFRWMGDVDIDDDEMQCIIANLIYEDKIKGYISYQHKKLVISKANAFPPLSAKLKS